MRTFFAVAALCLSLGASAQLPDSATQQRLQTLTDTVQTFERTPRALLESDAGKPALKTTPVTEACGTFSLPDAGESNGKHLWGVVNRAMPNSNSCYISNDEPWDYWTVPVTPGEQVTFAVETSIRTYISIDFGAVYSGISALQSNGKYLAGYVWTVPASYTSPTVRIAVSPYGTAVTYTLAVSKPLSTTAACTTSATNLCLNGNRFKVQATYDTGSTSGAASATGMTTDTGYFYFFNASNVELLVKIVDGRGINGKFWVFAGGLTNVDTLITITDTQTGAVKTYRNPANTAFQPIQDTSAF